MNEMAQRTWWLLAVITAAVVVITAALHAGGLGFWEPWESTPVRVGAEAAQEQMAPQDDEIEESSETSDDHEEAEEAEDADIPVDSRAVPTLEGEPVQLSWLKSKWASFFVDDRPVAEVGGVGDVERRTRLPLLIFAVLLFGASALWARRYLGDGPAAMTVVVLATSPIFYLGAVLLSGPLIYMAASALCVLAFHQSIYGKADRRLWWALAAGLALAVVALDERLIGVYATLAVLVGWGISEAVGGARDDSPPVRWGWVLAGAVLFGLAIGWGFFESGDYDGALFRPDIVHRLWVIAPAVLLASLAMASAKTPVGRALTDGRGLLCAAGGVIPIVVLGTSYASAVPVDPDLAEQGIPTLAFLLENQALQGEVTAEGNFSWWWRQIGFGLLPHIIFLVPALGFLAWKLRPESTASKRQRAIASLILAWPLAAFAVVAPASALGHTAYPAFFPLILAVGWMIGDEDFWKTLRLRPGMYLAVAVMAIFAIMVLTKDLENFSSRFVEFAVGGIEEPDFAENFEYGAALDLWGKAMMIAIIAYFAGAISWIVFACRDAKKLWAWLKGLPKKLRQCWRRWRNKEDAEAAAEEGSSVAWQNGEERMAARDAWRDEKGLLSRVARRVERLPGLVALVTAGGLGLMAITFAVFLDDLDSEISSRAVLELYLEAADDDEKLWKYQVDEEPMHFYVRQLEEIENRREFNELFESDERFFGLIPESDLAQVHSRVRRDHEVNLPILAAGGGMYLITNYLADGEVDVNPLSDFILDEPDDDMIPLLVEVDGEEKHPEFDGQVEYLGYRLDRGGEGERAVYRWGDTMEITSYFKVNRRVPTSQEIFMHIDLSGNRLHGDHDPVDGLYPTNHWGVGDVIKDVHEVEIERFSAPGEYTIWTGFYRGDSRMSVTPEEAHDGQDRVDVATIEVRPL